MTSADPRRSDVAPLTVASADPRRSDVAPLTAAHAMAPDPIRLGEVLAASGYFSDARDAAKAAVKVMAGLELGFGPIAAMTGVHIIDGKPSIGANLLAALVKRSARYSYRVVELTDERCVIQFYERDGGEWAPLHPVSEFTMADAKRAGVAGKANWQRYPRNMLFARNISNGVTWHCPDLLGGTPIYTPDELGADVNEHGDALPPLPPAPPVAPAPPLPPAPPVERATPDDLRDILRAASEQQVDGVQLSGIILDVAGHPPREFADTAAADAWVDTALARLPRRLVRGVIDRIESGPDVPIPDALLADSDYPL